MSRKIKPKDWNRFSANTRVMNGAPFVAFKTPISTDYSWTLRKLVQKFPNLDHLIDLNFTDKYYNPAQLQALNPELTFVRIPTKGHELPNLETINRFFDSCDEILEENENATIGVICTYGNNRAGYMICRYLIERKGWLPQDAIDEFKEARGYGIERPHYLTSLRKLGSHGENNDDDDDDDDDDLAIKLTNLKIK